MSAIGLQLPAPFVGDDMHNVLLAFVNVLVHTHVHTSSCQLIQLQHACKRGALHFELLLFDISGLFLLMVFSMLPTCYVVST